MYVICNINWIKICQIVFQLIRIVNSGIPQSILEKFRVTSTTFIFSRSYTKTSYSFADVQYLIKNTFLSVSF